MPHSGHASLGAVNTEARSYAVVLVQPVSPHVRWVGTAGPEYSPSTQFDVVSASPEAARDLVASWTFDPSRRRAVDLPTEHYQAAMRWEASYAASLGEGDYVVVVDRLNGQVASYRMDAEQVNLPDLAWSEVVTPEVMQSYDVRNLDPIIKRTADARTIGEAVRDVQSAGNLRNRVLILDAGEFHASHEYARAFITAAFVGEAARIYVTNGAAPAFRAAAAQLEYGDRVGYWGSPMVTSPAPATHAAEQGAGPSLQQL